MFVPWEAATRCTDGPQPGAIALMKWFLINYAHKDGYNLGIYNCRTVRGGTTTSTHGEGRALDLGFPVGDPDGDRVLRRLKRNAGRLGIQCIIYNRRIYSAKNPDGAEYTGLVPHLDHLHVELNREAAAELTFEKIERVLYRHQPGSRDLKMGDTGLDVRYIQRRLIQNEDGVYGETTAKAVRAYERTQKNRYPKIRVDGVVGRLTWHTLGVKVTY